MADKSSVISDKDATCELLKNPEVQEWGAGLPPHTDLEKIVSMDTCDHYRVFAELEKVLVAPLKLNEDCTHQISPPDQKMLVEK